MKTFDTRVILSILLAFTLQVSSSQINSQRVEEVEISNALVVKLGHSKEIRELHKKSPTSQLKKERNRRFKKVPNNFKGRTGKSKAIYKNLEHQGPDLKRQKYFEGLEKDVEPLVNINGLGDNGSPHDPSGDVSDKFYVQMINGTDVGVFNLEGTLIEEFDANTLWSDFNQSSAGDPIVLYDENVDRWILTEFADPANILIAISDDGDPLGAYTAYNFSTPNFPDYPKYGISPNILTITTNEQGGSQLHNYFIDLQAMYAGEEEVDMQRIEIAGNTGTEGGFYVTTPVDWNGTNAPFDERPIVLNLNDSSWPGGPTNDQIDLYSFDINFNNSDSSEVLLTSIETSPYDAYPCSESGFGFACVPQLDGSGLDGVPEVIMNIPHMRNFETHESIVFSFITDVTDGDNLSGIRWTEFRRTSKIDDWKLYQEGTFAPDDGIDRYMPSIAIDENGSIGLAYNTSSLDSYVGARFTGRLANDPKGMMTVTEFRIVDGRGPISSGERFGDYSQMSVSPAGNNTFWWTSEYAGTGPQTTQTRIVAFRIEKDSFDLALRAINSPTSSSSLADEAVNISIINSGLETIQDYQVNLLFRDEIIETKTIAGPIEADEIQEITFDTLLNLSEIGIYDIAAIVSTESDQNPLNDTLRVAVRQVYAIEAGLSGFIEQNNCTSATKSQLTIINNGELPIDSLKILVEVNDILVDSIFYKGSISFDQSIMLNYDVLDLPPGINNVSFRITMVNGGLGDGNPQNDDLSLTASNLPADHFITLEFLTDDYPEESTWEVTLQGSQEVLASGDFLEAATLFTEVICVNPDSCYTLTVFDSQSDGICCGFGQGNFNVYDNQGILLVSNDGNFASQTTENFCAKAVECSLEIEVSTTDASSENVADGIILIEASSGTGPYTYSIDGGETFQDTATFTGLSSGEYSIIVRDDSGNCENSTSVTVGFTSSVFEVNGFQGRLLISPNPTNGLFKIEISETNLSEAMLKIQILNISGQVLQERRISKYGSSYLGSFSLMTEPQGTYLIKIHHPQFSYLQRVILIK